MSFFETPRFPEDISYGAVGGPAFSTDVVVLGSGFEQRNSNWDYPLQMWTVDYGVKSQEVLNELITFFRMMKGKAHGFRFKDWLDYTTSLTDGYLGTTGVGTGVPTYELGKLYSNAAGTQLRQIQKPVSGSVTVYRNGSPVTVGGGAGQISINYTTGVVTFVNEGSSGVSGITVGATTEVVLTSNPGTLVAGQKIYLTGFTGTDAALLNGLAHTINSVTGAGPYTFVLATNTSGKTITLGSTFGYKYPQATDTLRWVGEFDVPCRFDTDRVSASLDTYGSNSWNSIPVKEIRQE